MELKNILHEFKTHLEMKGYASSTISGYMLYLSYFLEFLRGCGIADLKQVSYQTVRDYQLLVSGKELAEESKAMRIRPIKRLFGWMLATHQLLLDPTEKIQETNRKNRRLVPVLTIEEMQRLLAQPNLSLRMQIRDRAIMETLYSSGIRLGELLNLAVHDVDLKEGTLLIRKAKGNRQRVVPLGKNAGKYVREYLEKIRPRYAKKNPKVRTVFLTDEGKPITGAAIRCALFNYKKSAGITKTASPHSFRRSCATHLLQQGADIRYVQQLLGHRRLQTTQHYTRVYLGELKKSHERIKGQGL
jgi:integrase/recombinase XerD